MKSKIAYFLSLLCLAFSFGYSQNVGIGTTTPNNSSILDVSATNKGVLIPQIALTSTISNAPIGVGIANSLLVYNTATASDVIPGYYYWDGSKWVRLLASGNPADAWLTRGNAGTIADTNFLGTTDSIDLVFKTNNTEQMRIDTNGNVGIGIITPVTKLVVWGTHPGAGTGTGVNSDAASQVIIPAGSDGVSHLNDWPINWGGGLSTWDINGSGAFFSTYATRSDSKFKQDIKSIYNNGYDNLLSKFMKIEPVQYYLDTTVIKTDISEAERLRFGFIANDVENIFPNLVINAGAPQNITRGLEYDGFIPVLVAITQKQEQKIEAQEKISLQLKQQNKLLKEENAEIKEENKKLEKKVDWIMSQLKK